MVATRFLAAWLKPFISSDAKLLVLWITTRSRFVLRPTATDTYDTLKLEENADKAIFAELAAACGHELSPLPANSSTGGQAGAIVKCIYNSGFDQGYEVMI